MKVKKIEGKKLAEGEATGHAHIIDESEVFELENKTRIFDGTIQNVLTHEEHKSITLPKIGKKYVSGKVLEYDHFTEEAKQVQD
jgi:hypothetical protein